MCTSSINNTVGFAMVYSDYYNLVSANGLLIMMTYCHCYNMDVFENYEMSKNSFNMELEMVKQFRDILKGLLHRKTLIENYMQKTFHHCTPIFFEMIQCHNRTIKVVEESCIEFTTLGDTSQQNHHNDMVYPLSTRDVMESAARGTITLYDVYHNNMSLYSKGYLSWQKEIIDNNRRVDSLGIDDMVYMSSISMNHLNWYDTGIKFLKAALNIFESLESKFLSKDFDRLTQVLMSMYRHYPILHNEILNKKTNPIGPGWKAFPFMISSGNHAKF